VTGESPTLRQRELGTRLRQLRNDLDLTVEDVGEKLLCSATKISRIETGTRRPSLRDVRDLCRLYGVSESETAELMELARMAREQGWWKQYSDLKLDPYIGLEQEATSITSYTMYYFPALLQTADYAREIIKAIAPGIEPKVHEERVEARLRRQELLDRENRPRYRVLLDEAVLHHRVGGSAVMTAQLDKVLKLEHEGKATVQVLPYDSAHIAQDSNFVVFDFDGRSLSPVVFVEGLTKLQYQERKADIDRYREEVDNLRDSALSPRESIARIEEMRKSYADGENPLA
jgi:transcriptional regulator with XRE-family HTH domain